MPLSSFTSAAFLASGTAQLKSPPKVNTNANARSKILLHFTS